jgi:quinolinate synthase
MYQPPLPEKFTNLTSPQAVELIRSLKEQLAGRMVILGHHYQRDDIIQFADFTGDSLKLSQIAAEQKGAEFIVFCGVHFMAESADILSAEHQKILLPDLTAGCSMADMAEIDQVENCWEVLQQQLPHPQKLIPVTYVNSSAAIKAFCGKHNGLCCTSSNCPAIFEYLWQTDPQTVVLFLPDEHLGRNTAYRHGIDLADMALWDPYEPQGAVTPEQLSHNRIVLWKGFCSVHLEFTPEQIRQAREENPDVKVIVHPECSFEVAQLADYVGSTEYIINTIRAAQAPSDWVVGTEINLVNRLARQMEQMQVKVRSLSGCPCLCETMYRIDLPHLAWLLDNIYQHCQAPEKIPLVNQVSVDSASKKHARRALEKMLDITAAPVD